MSAELPRGYDVLTAGIAEMGGAVASFAPNEAYAEYLRMHKVYVGRRGAEQLENIYESLAREDMPDYLSAAGWAAAEAAVVRTDWTQQRRTELLHKGVACWRRAIGRQLQFNISGPEYAREDAQAHRMALDIACAPLFESVITGKPTVRRNIAVFEDCLAIAQSNVICLNLAAREQDIEGMAAHIGLGYECNALLAYNRDFSPHRFAAPSTGRSDSGYHHPGQTHDLQIIQHGGGAVRMVTPVEVKSAASVRDRKRFMALLVRGKMHLSAEGQFTPDCTLEAITAAYEGRATREQASTERQVRDNMVGMVKKYRAGATVTRLASRRSATTFHDSGIVASHYPGISRAG